LTTPTYVNGFGGNAQFAAFVLVVESWSLNISTEALDVTTTGSAGWEQNIAGTSNAEGSCKTFFDTTSSPTGAAGLIPGTAGTLTLNIGSSGKAFVLPVRITQVGTENPTKGVVTFNLSFKSNGVVTFAS
jgi:predicted secreted protein